MASEVCGRKCAHWVHRHAEAVGERERGRKTGRLGLVKYLRHEWQGVK